MIDFILLNGLFNNTGVPTPIENPFVEAKPSN